MPVKHKPTILVIMDGWGVAPDGEGNAITRANLPNFKKFLKNYPAMTIYSSGTEVGLSFGEMGNSEVGHLNLGGGRVYYQSLPRINIEIEKGDFYKNPVFLNALNHSKEKKSKLHFIGLLNSGNVHSCNNHLHALLKFCKENKFTKNVYLHLILDGRDSIYNSAPVFIKELNEKIKEYGVGEIASLSGRYYAMDRDNHWERCEKAYRAMAEGVAERKGSDPFKIIEDSYANKNYDEEFIPAVITKGDEPVARIEDGDSVVFFNFRPDRARQLTKAFVLPGFNKFERKQRNNLFFATMTEYEKELPVEVAYPPVVVRNSLGEVISKAGLKQLHIAETEKYAHITFFLNGTIEEPFMGEDRLIIPSPKVTSYDQTPEMSSALVTKEMVKAIESEKYDFIAVNFANADMVGHTGEMKAVIKACEAVDKAVGEVVEHALAKNGAVVITGDHGNAEEVVNLQTGERDKEHSNNPVPLLVIANDLMGQAGPSGDPPEGDLSLLAPVGMLSDVAPTVLSLMDVEKPPDMTGSALI